MRGATGEPTHKGLAFHTYREASAALYAAPARMDRSFIIADNRNERWLLVEGESEDLYPDESPL